MKNLFALIMACILGIFTLAGCGAKIQDVKTQDEQTKQNEIEQNNNTIPEINETMVLELVQQAIQHKIYVQRGGNWSGEAETFDYNGMEYRYFGEDLGNREKLLNYLQETFTREAAEEFIKHYNYIENNGRMAQPNADGGSILQWENAEVTLSQDAGNSKEYIFKVPYGFEDNLQFETISIRVAWVPETGWRVASWTGLFD